MCTYLNNMGGYKHNQLKGRSYEGIQKLFDKAYKQVNSFVPMDSVVVKSSKIRTEGSSKRVGDELESDTSKKQKIDEHVEAEGDNDKEEEAMKKHMEIVQDDEVAIDAIPLATKHPYPLTPATITERLNKKLQADYWNEMCYQLLKLMTNAAGTKVNAAGMKVTTTERLQLLEEFPLSEG
ncbi:hypothetical protein Tco_1437574 [Tanacetum coccineum]